MSHVAVDGTAVEEVGTDLEPVEAHRPPTTLFGTDDPDEFIERASKAATSLKKLIQQQNLVVAIQGKEYPKVEAWTTLGSMLGVSPVCVWTRELENGWEARVEARTLDGRVLGAAEAQCTRDEKMWAKRDGYALRSMAQTRSTAKALRVPLGFVFTLAGYEATPSEEMPSQPGVADSTRSDRKSTAPPAAEMTGDQYAEIVALYKAAGAPVELLGAHLACEPNPAAIMETIKAASSDDADRIITFLKGIAVL